MKTGFFSRLGSRLAVIPLGILFLLYLSCGIAYVAWTSLYPAHESDVRAGRVIFEKRLAVDSWFAFLKNDIENFSRMSVLRGNLLMLLGTPSGQVNSPGVNRRGGLSLSQLIITECLRDKASSGRYRLFVLLSKDGRVLSSSNPDFAGDDWSEKPFFRKETEELKTTEVLGMEQFGDADYGILLVTPILNATHERVALLYTLADPGDLKGLLGFEGRTGQEGVVLTDRTYAVIMTREGIPAKSIRLLEPHNRDGVPYRKDDSTFASLNLRNAPFHLIYNAGPSGIALPPLPVVIAYGGFGMLLLLFLVVLAARSGRLITRPAAELQSALWIATEGGKMTDFQETYKGEMLALRSAIRSLGASAEKRAEEAGTEGIVQDLTVQQPIEHLPALAAPFLDDIAVGISAAFEKKGIAAKDTVPLLRAREAAAGLRQVLDDLSFLVRLKRGEASIAPGQFNLCILLSEIEEALRGAMDAGEGDLIVDCHEVFHDRNIEADKECLRRIIVSLLRSAALSAAAGTVTCLATLLVRDGRESAEVIVADAGGGGNSDHEPAGIVIARELSAMMGMPMDVTTSPGEGTVCTIELPVTLSMG